VYTLKVRLKNNNDEILEIVGFKDLQIKGQDFFLNGVRTMLKGVCRHEFMDNFGYTPPVEAIEKELAQIKHAGFNYVRLVHFAAFSRSCPHCRAPWPAGFRGSWHLFS